ncbi:hypothetical protein, partial [Photobacterium sanctipauli]
IISDISSVASDYLFTEKPFAIVDVQNYESAIYERFPLSRASYVIDAKLKNLSGIVKELAETDSMKQLRCQLKSEYIYERESF